MRFPADIAVLASVRDFAIAAAREMGSPIEPEALAVVVGELAANAAVHQGGEASLGMVALDDGGLRIVVDDLSHALPELVERGAWDVKGHRGLQLLGALTSEWGAESTDTGKRVWAVMRPRPEATDTNWRR